MAYSGNQALVDYVITKHKLKPTADTLDNAAYSGNQVLVEYLITKHDVKPTDETLNCAAESGNQTLIIYLKNLVSKDSVCCIT